MNKTLLYGVTFALSISLAIPVLAAPPRSCDDEQVYLAVMKSARRDLPAPYSEMDVQGSTGVKALGNGQCKMRLFMVGGPKGQKDVDVTYSTAVPLSQIRVSLASPECTPIRFKAGHISATVSDSVSPGKTKCYSVATGANQTMEVSILSRMDNTAVTIPGVGDARDRFEFLTKKKTYKLNVFQLMQSASKDQYSLTVTIR